MAQALHLTAEFFDGNNSNYLNPVNYVAKLRSTMQQLLATPPRRHSRHKAYISKVGQNIGVYELRILNNHSDASHGATQEV